MESQLKEYRALLSLSQQEKDAVIKNDVSTLASVVEQQQSVLSVIKKLETEKERLLSEARTLSGLVDGKLRISDVIQYAREDVRGKLQSLADDLEDTGKKLRAISMLNKTLIDTQLKYTAFWINMLTGQGSTPATYSGAGHVNEGSVGQPCLVDQAI